MSGSRPSSVAALAALNAAYLAPFGEGLRSASLRRSGRLEHPKLFLKFRYFDKLVQFFVIRCFVRKKMARYSTKLNSTAAAATARTKFTLAAAQQQQ